MEPVNIPVVHKFYKSHDMARRNYVVRMFISKLYSTTERPVTFPVPFITEMGTIRDSIIKEFANGGWVATVETKISTEEAEYEKWSFIEKPKGTYVKNK